jgi:lysophospholipase L1-like esterase
MNTLLLILALALFQPTDTVVFVGDSITAGYYPEIAAKALHTPLYRYAVQGARIKRIHKLVDKALAKKPTYVVLYAGLNDCADANSDPYIVFNRLERLVRKIEFSDSTPVVVKHHGWFGEPKSWHGSACSYLLNSMMESRWEGYIRMVDTRYLADQEDTLLKEYDAGDGLHLNYRGHKALAEMVVKELTSGV